MFPLIEVHNLQLNRTIQQLIAKHRIIEQEKNHIIECRNYEELLTYSEEWSS